MDHLHFGARSRRKVRRRQLTIAAWLIGLVAMFLGVPGSNAALTVFHSVEHSHAASASSISAPHGPTGSAVVKSTAHQILIAPKPLPTAPSHKTAEKVAKRRQRAKDEHKPAAATASPAPSPSPSPSPVPVPAAPAGSLSSVIYNAAAQAGIDGGYLLSIANCESSLNPQAHSSSGYYGLFQFDQSTWAAYGYGSIYDPVAQSQTAARLIAAGQTSRWPNCA